MTDWGFGSNLSFCYHWLDRGFHTGANTFARYDGNDGLGVASEWTERDERGMTIINLTK